MENEDKNKNKLKSLKLNPRIFPAMVYFYEMLLANKKAAVRDENGKLPQGTTHEITFDEDGYAVFNRVNLEQNLN